MSESRAVPPSEKALGLLRRYFLCRTDTVAFLAPWERPSPAKADGQLDELLLAHLKGSEAPKVTVHYRNSRGEGVVKGHFRIGAYAPAPDGTTRWLCLDFDGGDHAEALADPTATALAVYRIFESAGTRPYLERSGGGHGWHLWCFFDPPVSARKARAMAKVLLPEEVTLANGERALPQTGRGIEVFPKQPKIGRNGFGNLVWLPWWSEANGAANQFHRPDEKGGLVPFVPEEFETADEPRVDAVIAQASTSGRDQPRASPQPAKPHEATDEVWREWRERALAALPLEAIYGQWLTGKTCADGWLQCRDPWSPTGDRDPSAGVADGSGQAERGEFHSFISGRSLSVFDFLVERGEVADFRAACTRIAQMSDVPLPATARDSPRHVSPHRRPTIQVNNRQLRDVVADSWSAVHAANRPPTLFVRSGALARLQHADDGCRIEATDEAAIYGFLARSADWVKVTDTGVTSVSPVRDVARDMLAYPDEQVPQLEAVVCAPVFDGQGRLISEAGYHPAARLWYHRLPGFSVEAVPERPTVEQVGTARDLLLDDLLVDFPFASEADRAHAVAALFLPFVRRIVDGCTPIHLIEAHTPGSGKGLLADVVALIALGRCCEPTTVTPDEEEARKKITSLLARAQPVILLDNIRTGIESAQLAAALTAEVWSDRLLGQNRMIDLPNRATWLVTANNPRLSLEIARRCARIRLDPRTDRPWERTAFKHAPLREWIRANRARLVHALLVLVQAWIATGKPQGQRVLGSFESWSRVIGGILGNAGIDHFLGNTEELYETADAEGNEWREFVAAWWDAYHDNWVAAKDLLELALERDLLGSVIGDKSLRSQQTRLGRALAAVRDRQFGEWRVLMRRDAHTKGACYRLDPADGCGTCGTSCGTSDPQVPQEKASNDEGSLPLAEPCGCSAIPSPHAREATSDAGLACAGRTPVEVPQRSANAPESLPGGLESKFGADVEARTSARGSARFRGEAASAAGEAEEPVDLASLSDDEEDAS